MRDDRVAGCGAGRAHRQPPRLPSRLLQPWAGDAHREAERKAFIKAFLPVHKKMESRVGTETIKSIYDATGFDPASF
jgi:hypothetical protein